MLSTRVFCGDFDGDGRADAIAFVFYNPAGGNGVFDKVVLFRNVAGVLRYVRSVPNIIGDPQAASFRRGGVELDMLTLKDSDAACCPTGRSRVFVDVAAGTHRTMP